MRRPSAGWEEVLCGGNAWYAWIYRACASVIPQGSITTMDQIGYTSDRHV